MATVALPRHVVAELDAIRAHVRDIVPGGRNPEGSYMAKRDAMRGLDRLIKPHG